jgi:hypothetical protein
MDKTPVKRQFQERLMSLVVQSFLSSSGLLANYNNKSNCIFGQGAQICVSGEAANEVTPVSIPIFPALKFRP